MDFSEVNHQQCDEPALKTLKQALGGLIDQGLDQSDIIQVMHERFGGASPAEIARVRGIFDHAINAGDHNVAVDDIALTSRVDAEDGGGLWVQGWLWIPGPDEDEDTLD
jgi:hypothetical protein